MSGMDETMMSILRGVEAQQREMEQAREDLPCHFDLKQVSACSDDYAQGCKWTARRFGELCPRQILREQGKQRAVVRQGSLERGIPERVLRQVLDRKPVESHAIRAVRAFMHERDRSILVLSGANACGKTTAAAWACLPPEGENWAGGRFVRLVDLEAAGRYSDLLTTARTSKLLVLDDVGAAHFGQTGWMASMVDDVVDAVYQACNKVILTTDLAMAPDPKDPARPCLAKLLSRRVLSRIKDAGIVETKLGGRHEAGQR